MARRFTNEQIRNSYDHHPPANELVTKAHERVRGILATAACQLNDVLPEGRHKSLALTAIEESRLWANTAVAL